MHLGETDVKEGRERGGWVGGRLGAEAGRLACCDDIVALDAHLGEIGGRLPLMRLLHKLMSARRYIVAWIQDISLFLELALSVSRWGRAVKKWKYMGRAQGCVLL